MEKDSQIYIAGHRGLAGSAIVRNLQKQGYSNLLLRTHAELDLTNQAAVTDFFGEHRPKFVVMAAAKVGGILANSSRPAEFIRENLLIQNNLIEQSYQAGVSRLLFLGSSCIYPKTAPQPMREDALLTGPLEPTNRPYALAKIAGIEMCWSYNRQYGTRFLAAMPTNMYGPNDNFDLQSSHVLPALIRKVVEAKAAGERSVVVWGSGKPMREFLYSDDLAEACTFLLNLPGTTYDSLLNESEPPLINIGVGEDISIRGLAEMICDVLEFRGKLEFDASKPDGTPQKLMDVGKMIGLGWHARTTLRDGIRRAYESALQSGVFSAAGLSAQGR